jgi:hypothetical protein
LQTTIQAYRLTASEYRSNVREPRKIWPLILWTIVTMWKYPGERRIAVLAGKSWSTIRWSQLHRESESICWVTTLVCIASRKCDVTAVQLAIKEKYERWYSRYRSGSLTRKNRVLRKCRWSVAPARIPGGDALPRSIVYL